VGTREDAARLRGEPLVLQTVLGADEWLAADLVGCRVEGLGEVRRVLAGVSCDVLELDDGTLVPLVSDAVRAVDSDRRRIEVDLRFLGLDAG
jgi:ribosomal 30S subunit maturation factor RimM